MECESTITFNTNSIEKCGALEQSFKRLEGTSPNTWDDKESRINDFSELSTSLLIGLEIEELLDHLDELDTGVTDTSIEGTKLSIDIFPREFPEELCDYIFPILNKNGYTEISCHSWTEYGNLDLEFKGGEVKRSEDFFEED